MSIKYRLSRLEQRHSPARGFVICVGDDETDADAITSAGILPTDRDLVILLRRGGVVDPAKRFVSQFEVSA